MKEIKNKGGKQETKKRVKPSAQKKNLRPNQQECPTQQEVSFSLQFAFQGLFLNDKFSFLGGEKHCSLVDNCISRGHQL